MINYFNYKNIYNKHRELIEPPMRWVQNEILLQKDNKFKFNLNFKDSNCSREEIIRAVDQISSQESGLNPRAFIGPVCPFAAQMAALFGKVWNIPVISPGANSMGFDEEDSYPTLVRVLPTFDNLAFFIHDVFKELGWVLTNLIIMIKK